VHILDKDLKDKLQDKRESSSKHNLVFAPTLSQKQFEKYFSAEFFPASMGIMPVLF
jgi:hypothetical protein